MMQSKFGAVTGWSVARRIAAAQLAVAVLTGAVWWLAVDAMSGASALAGGATSALLSLYTGLKTFGVRSAEPSALLGAFYRAQAWKLVLAVVLFGVAVHVFGRHFLPYITAYAATIAVYWFSLLWEE